MNELYRNYKYPILGALLGLFLAILLIAVGFFKTLLVLLFLLVGAAIGWYLQVTGLLDSFFKNRK
jgi:uncharacterized membrane protein